jgi:hypothetical protein
MALEIRLLLSENQNELQSLFCKSHMEPFSENPYYRKEIMWQVSQKGSGLLVTA